ncbi:unnamed protein product, partial [Meganyctiphanes norvegica]
MNATSLYVSTCRLVMQAEPEKRETWSELYKLLPYLRQSLSCTVCFKLLSDPYSPSENSCQHHVCRNCLGGKKRLKPNCSWCRDYASYVDNEQIKLVLQCYRKLCEYIKFTPIYSKLCSIYNNGGQISLQDMINEAIGHNHESVNCNTEECDSKENITLLQPNLSGVSTVNIITTGTLPRQPMNIASPNPTMTVQPQPSSSPLAFQQLQQHPHVATASPHISAVATTHVAAPAAMLGLSTPTAGHLIPSSFNYSQQMASSGNAQSSVQKAGNTQPGMVPGTIFSSTNVQKQNIVKEATFSKQNTNVNNGSSMYSVMYADGDSTKITIKRKPPETENNTVTVKEETVIPPAQEIKKPKPKPKPKPKRKGCRCGNATPTPGKLTCCGQRCPCYVEAKACIECRCRGCRNPHRPGGKKVRPIIPQLANIQIHQVQQVHGRNTTSSAPTSSTTHTIINPNTTNSVVTIPSGSTVSTVSSNMPQRIQAVQAMHAVQAVHGVGTVQAMTGGMQGMHHMISYGGASMVQGGPPGLHIGMQHHTVAGITVKPVGLLSSVPTQLLINDDPSTSSGTSENSDVIIGM